eukprot:11167255-Lingulodinium_polyedra.AAC.1
MRSTDSETECRARGRKLIDCERPFLRARGPMLSAAAWVGEPGLPGRSLVARVGGRPASQRGP